MSSDVSIPARVLGPGVLAVLVWLTPYAAMAQSIQGTATYRERMTLPPTAVLEATLEDVARADAPSTVVARARLPSPGNPPIAFTIPYNQASIIPDRPYVVRVRILLDNTLLFTSDVATPVITRGSPTKVSVMLRRIGADQTSPTNPASPSPSTPSSNRPLETTYWKAIELGGKPISAQNASREAHLVFQTGGRVSGSDGCNRISGSYELKGDGIVLGQMAGTQMACADTAEVERQFHTALNRARRWRIVGDRLELIDAAGSRAAALEARSSTPPPSPNTLNLQGTAWQLVRFLGGDDTRLTPDVRAKYTIEFGKGGQLTARIDCNRGRSTWKSSGSSQLELGTLALTRARCPAGSMHDQIVKQWSFIRSYVVKDGRLFLALMADGGTFEFERLAVSPK